MLRGLAGSARIGSSLLALSSRPLMSAAMATGGMSARERFLFDLNGFLVLRNVFTPTELAAANGAIDARAAGLQARDEAALRNTKAETPLAASGPRLDMGGMLYWPEAGASLFRSALTHERLVPYFTELLGEGYRLECVSEASRA